MRKFADRWRPYRGLALVYAYAEIARRSEVPSRNKARV
jgi:3-methyladenine DNA glycosylase/8-oxoguanine DNA glycosylase